LIVKVHKAGAFADREALVRWLIQARKSALEAAAFDVAHVGFVSAFSRTDGVFADVFARHLHTIESLE
jgi:hypothetical protein